MRLSQRLALRKFLQSAKAEDESLLLLEDDAAFSPGFEEVLTKALQADVDLVFLGGTHLKPPKPIEEEFWMKCTSLYDNQAIVFTREGARKTLSMLGQWRVSGNDVEIMALA